MGNQSLEGSIYRMPASFFAIVLGLAGLAGDWRVSRIAWGFPSIVGEVLYLVSGIALGAITVCYFLKWLRAPAAALEESRHAVQCCFIGLAGVATMLVAIGALPYSRVAAIGLFAAGSSFTLLFGLWRTGHLWHGDRDPASTTPVLYLPLVAGGFVMGSTLAALGWQSWGELAFGGAFFAWLALESVLLHRLYTAPPLLPALRPTLGIQLAPPSVGALCYFAVGGQHSDTFIHMLIGYALLQAVLLTRLWRWIREAPFRVSYWAFPFGATALAGASMRIAIVDPHSAVANLALPLFVLANLLVMTIALATLRLLVLGRLVPIGMTPTATSATR